MIQEDETAAQKYQNRSVAEQKSFDIGIDLLNQERFTALRATICADRMVCRDYPRSNIRQGSVPYTASYTVHCDDSYPAP